ncbi:MAG: bifunctional molybdenum cofactor biosynthesis protein MoaC/MoaB [Crocinitomicaceae bacterium]
MVDITAKSNSLRIATAEAIVKVSKRETIEAIKKNTVPKGNVFEMAKAAGFLGVKQTPNLLPDCHPIPIESTTVKYEIIDLTIRIELEVKTIYKTGVEVEAMHGASIVALTMYDMLKPIDKHIEIGSIRLLNKSGGKSDRLAKIMETAKTINAAVIVCSDTISAGQKEDRAGKEIIHALEKFQVNIETYDIIPDEKEDIQNKLKTLADNNVSLIIYSGGTGLSKRDVTPESLLPLIDRRIPGVEEVLRRYGQERMPYAMLSRSIVGTYKNSLVMALPGSTAGAKESMEAIMPHLIHVFDIFRGRQH